MDEDNNDFLDGGSVYDFPNRYNEGETKFQSERYREAFSLLQPLAEHGHLAAMYYVGRMYYRGLGVKKDAKMGLEMLNISATEGYERSKNMLKFLADNENIHENYEYDEKNQSYYFSDMAKNNLNENDEKSVWKNIDIFFYGSLRSEELLTRVILEVLPPEQLISGQIVGYETLKVEFASFPMLVHTGNNNDIVDGLIGVNLDERMVKKLDHFEGEGSMYHREKREVIVDGKKYVAHVYIPGKDLHPDGKWDYETFSTTDDYNDMQSRTENWGNTDNWGAFGNDEAELVNKEFEESEKYLIYKHGEDSIFKIIDRLMVDPENDARAIAKEFKNGNILPQDLDQAEYWDDLAQRLKNVS